MPEKEKIPSVQKSQAMGGGILKATERELIGVDT